MKTLQEFEQTHGLTVVEAALLLGVPRPTYYQYRRTGVVPLPVERAMVFFNRMPKKAATSLIQEFVHGDTL